MEFCQIQYKVSKETVAKSLKITLSDYDEMIAGKLLLTPAQAKALGKLYNADSTFFYTAAEQLDHYLTSLAIMDALKAKHPALLDSERKGFATTKTGTSE
jgi:plasmid maintenance system antidote protein VapI